MALDFSTHPPKVHQERINTYQRFERLFLGQRYRDQLGGTIHRYVYDGDRVALETNDSGTIQATYTTAGGSYFAPLLHMTRGSASVFPAFDAVGAVRSLVDTSGTITDSYTQDAFGKQLSSSGSTVNPYRYGGEWGYVTEASGLAAVGRAFLSLGLSKTGRDPGTPDSRGWRRSPSQSAAPPASPPDNLDPPPTSPRNIHPASNIHPA